MLGSGTSSGVPTIGCTCATCASTDPRDNRLRPSILMQYGGKNVLIDTTPDFRAQALRARIARVDAILYTHAHADHILGLDDVRPLNYHQKMSIPAYGTDETLNRSPRLPLRLRSRALAIVGPPRGPAHNHAEPFDLFGLRSYPHPADARPRHDARLPLRQRRLPHRSQRHSGRLQGAASESGCAVPDALRHRPHPTHSTVAQAWNR